ncbi:DUF6153 family protein [Nocardia sp. R6R-6]|uniref:DUF6153 family protein n=1 Tax=Nocardia sp. R6R-6 TaxID=3459303 RepID=UPI00403DCB94
MVRRRLFRPAGFARLIGVLALLAGIVAMHSVVFTATGHATGVHGSNAAHSVDIGAQSGKGDRSAGGAGISTAALDRSERTLMDGDRAASSNPAVWSTAASGASGPDCAGDGCDRAHSGIHGCVFILVVLATLVALVLLYRMPADRPGGGGALARHWRPRRERPPPWTVLTLAELGILRI